MLRVSISDLLALTAFVAIHASMAAISMHAFLLVLGITLPLSGLFLGLSGNTWRIAPEQRAVLSAVMCLLYYQVLFWSGRATGAYVPFGSGVAGVKLFVLVLLVSLLPIVFVVSVCLALGRLEAQKNSGQED